MRKSTFPQYNENCVIWKTGIVTFSETKNTPCTDDNYLCINRQSFLKIALWKLFENVDKKT